MTTEKLNEIKMTVGDVLSGYESINYNDATVIIDEIAHEIEAMIEGDE